MDHEVLGNMVLKHKILCAKMFKNKILLGGTEENISLFCQEFNTHLPKNNNTSEIQSKTATTEIQISDTNSQEDLTADQNSTNMDKTMVIIWNVNKTEIELFLTLNTITEGKLLLRNDHELLEY